MTTRRVHDYNRKAWNQQVAEGNPWTVPVDAGTIARARQGEFSIVLTPLLPVPRTWFPENLEGVRILCLASGGGQQGPILAATGAEVTAYDLSPAQLGRDREVAEREGLSIRTIEGDMIDMSALADASFDLIFNPASNCFCEDILPVWRECYRVLRPGGEVLAGFFNPDVFIFDDAKRQEGELVVRHPLPYSDIASLSEEELRRYTDKNEPLSYSHSMDAQIGGQLAAGFVLVGFYEDNFPVEEEPIAKYMSCFYATRARKPAP